MQIMYNRKEKARIIFVSLINRGEDAVSAILAVRRLALMSVRVSDDDGLAPGLLDRHVTEHELAQGDTDPAGIGPEHLFNRAQQSPDVAKFLVISESPSVEFGTDRGLSLALGLLDFFLALHARLKIPQPLLRSLRGRLVSSGRRSSTVWH